MVYTINRSELYHSAKGTTWADHKYIAIRNGQIRRADMFKAIKRDKLDELMHSAKGTTWSDHKYIAIKNGRYIYPEEAKRGLSKLREDQISREHNRRNILSSSWKNAYIYEQTHNEKVPRNANGADRRYARTSLANLYKNGYGMIANKTTDKETQENNLMNRHKLEKPKDQLKNDPRFQREKADQLKNDPRFQKKDATADDAVKSNSDSYERKVAAMRKEHDDSYERKVAAMRKEYDDISKEVEQHLKETDAMEAEMKKAHEEFEKKIEQGEIDRKEARARMQKYQDAFDKSWNETMDMMNKQRAIMKGMMLGFTRPVSSIVKALTYKKNKVNPTKNNEITVKPVTVKPVTVKPINVETYDNSKRIKR